MNTRFWVVGGEYTDTSFNELVSGSERVMGPYSDRDAALVAWRRVAEEIAKFRSATCVSLENSVES